MGSKEKNQDKRLIQQIARSKVKSEDQNCMKRSPDQNQD